MNAAFQLLYPNDRTIVKLTPGVVLQVVTPILVAGADAEAPIIEAATTTANGNSLTIGPNGSVRANVSARNVIVGGTLDGDIQAGERTELRKSAVVNGDVQTQRIAIEEGAYFKGKLEIQKPQAESTTMAASASPGAAAEQRK